MPDLAAFQTAFANALLAQQQPAGAMASEPGFAVYRNTCARGAIEALRAAYPTVDALIGEEAFTQAALDFRSCNPPRSPVLSSYGRSFPDFLARQPWTGELPYLADVAYLDRLWLDSFLAPDRESAPAMELDGRMPRITLHPATRFGWFTTPAMTIWQAHRQPGGFGELEPEWREEGALFTRRGTRIHADHIDHAGCLLLVACAGGVGIPDGLSAVERAYPHTDATSLLARLVGAGALMIH